MSKTQTKTTRRHRVFSWFIRHKIITGFTLLVLAGVLYLAISGIVYEFGIHIERQNYVEAASEMSTIKEQLSRLNPNVIVYDKSCHHSNFGGVFENDKISCRTGVTSTYLNTSQATNPVILKRTQNLLVQNGFNLKADGTNQSTEGIASYTFQYKRLTCYFDAWYYDQTTPNYNRDATMPTQGTETETEVYCGGTTRNDYFPVKD